MSEHHEQVAVIRWTEQGKGRWPELDLIYAVPNARNTWQDEIREGLKSGVPDLCLPVARAGYFGLYIEMKFGKNTVSDKQTEWMERLKEQGYYVTESNGREIAIQVLTWYIQQPRTQVLRMALPEVTAQNVDRLFRPVRCRLAASVLPLKQCVLDEGHSEPCDPGVQIPK